MEHTTGPAIILMQGPPACGKSTKARTIQEGDPENVVIVSRDSFRHARGKYWIPSQEKYITALEHFAISQGLEMGYMVVVDATNMNPAMISDMVKIAKSYSAPVVGVMCHETLETCLKRDLNKNREHSVGETVINKFYEKYVGYCNIHNIDIIPGSFSIHFIYNPENHATNDN